MGTMVRRVAVATFAALSCAALACDRPDPAPEPSPTAAEPTALVPVAPVVATPPVDQPAERWYGRVEVPGAAPLIIGLSFDPDVVDAATIDIPSQGVTATAMVDVAITPGAASFTLPIAGADAAGQARFTIARPAGATTATGTLVQAGVTMPVRLRLLADGESLADARRPQTPKPPFPYVEREASYTSADGTALGGTLTLPTGTGKHPALLLISGTGEQDRDATLGDHRFFAVIADHLTRAGIAVLRVDDRGVGDSGGNTSATGFEGKIADVVAGMGWLAAQPELDAARIGLLGHSEGGLIAPLVAAGTDPPTPPVAFMVLLGAPGVPIAELMITQMDQTLRAQHVSAERLAVGNAGQKRVVDAVLAGADDRALRAIVTAHVDAIFALTPAAKPGFFERRALIEGAMQQVATPAMRDFLRADPGPVLERVRCPVLALGGTMDLQVAGEANLAAIGAALARGHNPDVTTALVPGRNHLFQPATIGTAEEWPTIETTIDPAVLRRISDWLATRTGAP